MVAEGTANSLGPRIWLSSSTQFLVEHRTKKAAPRDPKDDEWRCSISTQRQGKGRVGPAFISWSRKYGLYDTGQMAAAAAIYI